LDGLTQDPSSFALLLRCCAYAPDIDPGTETDLLEFPGTELEGRYEVRGKLARGGMATVFDGWDHELSRRVAVKIMTAGPSDRLATPELAQTFEREARAIARLDHPNIVGIRSQGFWGERPYLVLEFVGDESLADRLAQGPMTPAAACELTRGMLAGLGHAHAAGVIHRDLKPANLLLTPAGAVKVLDFGLVSFGLHRADDGPVPRGADGGHTLLHAGTPRYMAPEQRTGESQDARTDLWMVGAILYEMLTGKVPTRTGSGSVQASGPGPGTLDVELASQLHPLSRDAWPRSTPRWLRRVVDRAVQSEPDDRFQDTASFLEALQGPRAKRSALVLGAAVLVAVGLGAAWTRASSERAELPGSVSAPDALRSWIGDTTAAVPGECPALASAVRYEGDGRFYIGIERLDEGRYRFVRSDRPLASPPHAEHKRHEGVLYLRKRGDQLLLAGEIDPVAGWSPLEFGKVQIEVDADGVLTQSALIWRDRDGRTTRAGLRRALEPDLRGSTP